MKCLIIIPAYNEAENIEKVINNLTENYPQYDYIIVNDGSTDGTEEICRRNHYQVLNLPINMGIGGAVQTGYCYARDNGYEAAVQIDGDGQHDVAFLADMLKPLETGQADMVIGSRFVQKEGFQSSQLRRVGIRFLSNLGWLLTGNRVKDITSGYRVVDRRFIRIFAQDYPADYPEPEAIVIASVYGGRIREYPVVMREREKGESSITFKKSIYYMCKVTLAMVIRRISFGVRRQKK
ncbi:undecaprenyl-phosphate mannosyltransferase [Lachnospiraceae bacterium]|nr:undecaprenyl-phosphate mannosyltransferase [Lachnospiraceae bacterium]